MIQMRIVVRGRLWEALHRVAWKHFVWLAHFVHFIHAHRTVQRLQTRVDQQVDEIKSWSNLVHKHSGLCCYSVIHKDRFFAEPPCAESARAARNVRLRARLRAISIRRLRARLRARRGAPHARRELTRPCFFSRH